MKNLFKTEFKKATHNKMFLIALTIGTALSIYSALYVIITSFSDAELLKLKTETDGLTNPMLESNIVYNKWIGAEWNAFTSSLFFLLLPLISTLPFSSSFCVEKKIGYINNIFTRTKRKNYINAKFAATFSVGFLSAFIPVLINLMIVTSFFPMLKPKLCYDIYYTAYITDIFSELFYTYPLLHLILKVVLICTFAGSFAVFGQAIGMFSRNKYIAVFSPCIFFIVFNYVSRIILPFETSVSPIQFLYGGGVQVTSVFVIPAELFILIFGSFFVMRFSMVTGVEHHTV